MALGGCIKKLDAITMRLLAALLSILLTSLVNAKCINEEHIVTGSIRTENGQPLSDAIITVKWNSFGGIQSVTGTSQSNGNFIVKFYFDPLSGETAYGDECKRTLQLFTVTVSKRGYSKSKSKIEPAYETKPVLIMLRRIARSS